MLSNFLPKLPFDKFMKGLKNVFIFIISNVNPFPPSVPIWHRLAKICLILILEGIIKNISYERRDYESVDEKFLRPEKRWKTKSSWWKGLTNFTWYIMIFQ